MLSILVILLTFVLTLFGTSEVRKILLRRNILDTPNERSSHLVPTPRGGGWAILAVLLPSLLIMCFFHHGDKAPLWMLAGVVFLALISWQDDKKGVSAGMRLGLHILVALLGTMAFGKDAYLLNGWLPFWLDRTLMVLGWAWFINLYNFMDGIDGITSTETIALATGTFLVAAASGLGVPFASDLTLVLTGCCLGFLALNWHPAKIFMGDVGSVPLGFLTGFLLICLATHGQVLPALILPLYYIADSGITISRRALRREKIWQPHRQHFYQKAAQAAGRHDTVVYWIIGANLLLIVSAIIAVQHPICGLLLGIVVTAGLLMKMSFFLTKAGTTP